MISPNQQEHLAQEIRRLYAEAENEMLRKIAKRIEKGIDEPGWQEVKLAQLRQQRREIEAEIKKLDFNMPKIIRHIIEGSYLSGVKSAFADLLFFFNKADDPERYGFEEDFSVDTFGAVNAGAINAFVEATIESLEIQHQSILRKTNDIYRQVIAETAGVGLTGSETRRQTAQRALNRFADQGISTFKDRAGRNWDIASYAEMSTRTAIGQASIQGHLDRMQEQGRDLVIVSDHPEECQICRPWEGRILSISGKDKRYSTVSEATSAGLFHPNCGHTVGAYIEGLSRPIHAKADPNGYEERQQQRYQERQVRHWKRREAVAINEEEKKKAKAKVRAWQAKQREFIDETGRRRKYERESITRAR